MLSIPYKKSHFFVFPTLFFFSALLLSTPSLFAGSEEGEKEQENLSVPPTQVLSNAPPQTPEGRISLNLPLYTGGTWTSEVSKKKYKFDAKRGVDSGCDFYSLFISINLMDQEKDYKLIQNTLSKLLEEEMERLCLLSRRCYLLFEHTINRNSPQKKRATEEEENSPVLYGASPGVPVPLTQTTPLRNRFLLTLTRKTSNSEEGSASLLELEKWDENSEDSPLSKRVKRDEDSPTSPFPHAEVHSYGSPQKKKASVKKILFLSP